MPNILIRNDTSSVLNVAFWLTTPIVYTNELHPGATWQHDIGTFVFTLEIRYDHGPSNRFSAEDSWGTLGGIAGAVGCGTASVVVGGAWALGKCGPHFAPPAQAAMGTASGLMTAAGSAVQKFAAPKEGHILWVNGLVIPFWARHFVIRKAGEKFEFYDQDENWVRAHN